MRYFIFRHIIRNFVIEGCLDIIGLLTLLLILAFVFENFILILLFSLVIFVIFVGIKVAKDYIKYKDETPEQREERLKKEEMIREWRKKFR